MRPAPATVISCIALFVALGGTGYAVTALPRDSVGSTQLKKNAVKEAEIGNRAVTTAKLADQAITRAKLAQAAVTGDRVANDSLGGAQIDEASLGRVPFAADATHALTAGRADLADRVELADRATRATSAASADRAAVADAVAKVDRNQEDFTVPDADVAIVVVECDAGLEPVGGGFQIAPTSDFPLLVGSSPVAGAWRLEFVDIFAGDPVIGTAYALCIKVDGS
jgi:hypothetical protein